MDKEQLIAIFGQENVDAYEKWDFDSPIDDDRNFVFSCMNTLDWLIFNGNKEREIDYYNIVKNALQAAGGEEISTEMISDFTRSLEKSCKTPSTMLSGVIVRQK